MLWYLFKLKLKADIYIEYLHRSEIVNFIVFKVVS